MTWGLFLSTLLIASLTGLAVAGFAFRFLWTRLTQRLPLQRLNALELQQVELLQSFDTLNQTWKRFRSAEGMRELREARRGTKASSAKPTEELSGAAWKAAKRQELGLKLLEPGAAYRVGEPET